MGRTHLLMTVVTLTGGDPEVPMSHIILHILPMNTTHTTAKSR
jgi:hypothetical protein